MCPPEYQLLFLSFTYTYTPSRTVQTHLTTFSITLFQLTPSALGIPEYQSDVPSGVKTYRKIDRTVNKTHVTVTLGWRQDRSHFCFSSFRKSLILSIVDVAKDMGLVGPKFAWILTSFSVGSLANMGTKLPKGFLGR